MRFVFAEHFGGSGPSFGGAPTRSQPPTASAAQHYRALGVEPGAGAGEVRSAYRRLALRWHPDKNGGSEEATARFQQITEAYEALCQHLKQA